MKYMILLLSLFLSLGAHAKILTAQTDQIVEIDSQFNGRTLTFFGTLKTAKNINSVSMEIYGPKTTYTIINPHTGEKETVFEPAFFVLSDTTQHKTLGKMQNYLEKHQLLLPAPTIEVIEGKLFKTHIDFPPSLTDGDYTIHYTITDETGQIHHGKNHFEAKSVGLQKWLSHLAQDWPFLNALLVIVSATLISTLIRFAAF